MIHLPSTAPLAGSPFSSVILPLTTSGSPTWPRHRSPPLASSGAPSMWNGPSTEDGVPAVAAFTMSISEETPSRSENRMYSLRLSSVNCVARVSASIAAPHSACVTLFSRTKLWRWPARPTSRVRVRSDGAFLQYSAKAWVMLAGVRLRMSKNLLPA